MYNNSLHHGFGSIPRSILSVAGYVVLHSKSQWTQDRTTQFLHKRLRKDFNSEEETKNPQFLDYWGPDCCLVQISHEAMLLLGFSLFITN